MDTCIAKTDHPPYMDISRGPIHKKSQYIVFRENGETALKLQFPHSFSEVLCSRE
jgi:hypothetical protein